MATQRKDGKAKSTARVKIAARSAPRSAKDKNHTITPKERWLLITERARSRAQKRGFIGGNPVADWLEAEHEIDARYTTDYESIFFKTDAAEIIEQIKGIFAGHPLSQFDFDDFVDSQRGGLKSLARINRDLIDGTSAFAAEQTALLQESVRESVKTLKSLAHGELDTNGFARHAELSVSAMENVLSRVKSMAGMVGKTPPKPRQLEAGTPQKTTAPAPAKTKAGAKVATKSKAKAKTPAKTKARAKVATKSKAKTPAKTKARTKVATKSKAKAKTPAKRQAKTPVKRK